MKAIALLTFLAIANYSNSQTEINIDDSGEFHKLKGKSAPLFKSMTLDRKEVSLEYLKGKIVLVNFWSLSCGACFQEIVDFNNIMKKYPKEKFVIISLLDDTREDLLNQMDIATNGYRLKKSAFNNDKIDFQIIPNAKEIRKLYTDETSFPNTFILDKDGQITFYMSGYAPKRGIPRENTSEDMFTKEADRLLSASR